MKINITIIENIKDFIIFLLLLVFAYAIYVLVISPQTKPSITQKSPSVTSKPSEQIIAKDELGAWSLGYYTDEFGDLTDKGYIKLTGYGSFSNSATSNSPLRVEMFMSNGNRTPFFRFYEYNSSNRLRGYRDLHLFKCRIKDSQDHIFPLNLYMYRGSDGLDVKFYKDQIEHIDALRELINNEDSAKFSCDEEDQSNEYRFKLDFKYHNVAKFKVFKYN